MGATSDWSWSGVSFLALSGLVVSAFAAAGAAAGVGCWATDVRPARSRPAVMKPRVRIIPNALRRPLRRPVYLGLLGEWPGGFEPGPARIIPGSRPAAVRPRVAQTIPGKPAVHPSVLAQLEAGRSRLNGRAAIGEVARLGFVPASLPTG